MRSRSLIVLGAALFIGLIAVLFVNTVFTGVEEQQAKLAEETRQVRIVVASQELAFGTSVSLQNARLANWPANSVPAGAFTSIEEATKARVALRPIVAGEPILASKVSGANGRATLSANLPDGQVAFAIPIDPVSGAGGFIRPGDVVDVLVTRRIPGQGATESDKMTDLVLESIPVLGVDLVSDPNNTQPALGKTATLQVDSFGAQKLALAQQLGVITLALRRVGDTNYGSRSTVTGRNITASRLYIGERRTGGGGNAAPRPPVLARSRPPGPPPRLQAPVASGPSMTVVRGTKTSEVSVFHGY
jgi:pilus assembly protein CpaB